MSATTRTVIVGGGLAGGAAARTLREEGFAGHVTLLTGESHPPYERPPLSKKYLRGDAGRSDAHVEPEPYWAEHGVELLTGVQVEAIDLAGSRVELAGHPAIGFDHLVLATGAEPKRLPATGGDLDGVVTLRSFEDADHIRDRAGRADHILVVGDGWIGSEVAASLRARGRPVTLALPRHVPLERILGPEIGAVYDTLHRDNGVTMLREARIVAFDGDSSVRRAQTESGQWIDADLVVLAVGVTPRDQLARAAGLTVSDGVVVDDHLRTSDPRVLAAGDVANVPHGALGRPLRVEHWGAALAQGTHAARRILGTAKAYAELPYFFSDQYDTGMEFWGDPALPGDLVVRGELDARSFTAFWHRDGRVRAVLNMHVHHHHHDDEEPDAAGHGHHHDHGDAQASGGGHAGGHIDPATVDRLIRGSARVDAAALANPDVPLESLARR